MRGYNVHVDRENKTGRQGVIRVQQSCEAQSNGGAWGGGYAGRGGREG